MQQVSFNVVDRSGGSRAEIVEVNRLTIAGWAGRDQAAIEHHIAELAELGVKRPSTTPCFYRLGAELLTQAEQIDANFSVPVTPDNTDIFDSTGASTGAAGLLTSTTTTAREIQFALKVIW